MAAARIRPVLNVTIILLLLASAAVGLATALFFRVWALMWISPLMAIISAVVLRSLDFGFVAGVPVIIGSLIVSQTAYIATTLLVHRGELSTHDEIDGDPGEHREQNVGDENE